MNRVLRRLRHVEQVLADLERELPSGEVRAAAGEALRAVQHARAHVVARDRAARAEREALLETAG